MSIKNMHYDFKSKLNKLDSQQNRNLLIPEIDAALNEAIGIFVKIVAKPRFKTQLGFETTQRTIDDISPLVENDKPVILVDSIVKLPSDYDFFLRGRVSISKDNCKPRKATLYIRQHDDEFEEHTFTKSSFEWRTVNGLFTSEGIKLYHEGFDVNEVKLSYLRQHKYVHNAEDFMGGSYQLPSGQTLSGYQDCELPLSTHSEIVDIAVLIATGQLQIPDYQTKQYKLNFNQII